MNSHIVGKNEGFCYPATTDWLICHCLQMSHQDIGLLIEVLKTVVALFDKQGKHVQSAAPAVLQQCWSLVTTILPLYESAKIHSRDDDDDDGYVRLAFRISDVDNAEENSRMLVASPNCLLVP